MIDLTRIQDYIFSKIVKKFPQEVMTKYGMSNDNFTTNKVRNTEPTFPNVYVHITNSAEIGGETTGTMICGALVNFTIEVTDNDPDSLKSGHICREVTKIMKSLGFKANSLPITTNSLDSTVTIAQFSRIYGDGDSYSYST